MQGSHPSLYCIKTWNHLYMIHCCSRQEMLTAFFSLVWNMQKSQWTIFFKYQGKMFNSIEQALEKTSEDQP